MFKLIEESDTYCAMTYTGHAEDVVIPPTHWGRPVSALFDNLFRGHSEIRSVSIPRTVTQIGACVFDGCSSLLHIDLPDELQDMWQYAFARSSVEELVIPDGVRYLVPFTFKDCRRLRRVVCGTALEKVYANAFAGCDSLQEFVCGAKAAISPEAFANEPEIVIV